MKWKLPSRSSKWLVLPPLILAVAIVALLVAHRKAPQRQADQEESRTVRVIRVTALDVVPRALGHGTAQPGQVWRAIAEVHGRVAEIGRQVQSGGMVRQGELLLRIDPTEYDLAIARFEADIAQVEAEREELDVKEANDRASLEIEEASLTLAERELRRVEALVQRNAVSASEVDQQNRNLLAQRQVVQGLRNALQRIPHQRKSLEAALAVKRAGLAQAQLDREKTTMEAPFDCRLGEVNIQPGQYLAAGQSLFEAHGTEWTEIEAQLPLDQLRTLVDPRHAVGLPVSMDAESVERLFDFDVLVRYRSGEFLAEWRGRVSRMREQFDPRTRTIGLVIAVDRPYDQAIPGKRPPLVQGMFCEVEFRAPPRGSQIVIPRSALHAGYVYVVENGDRLQRRPVEVAFAQPGFLCLRKGLREGETLVVSDPTPAIEGSLVDAVPDRRLQEQLAAQATAEDRLR